MKELSLHILDLAENSIEAGAGRIVLDIHIEESLNQITIGVSDDGRGMDKEEIRKVEDPFYTSRTTRKVGMGIPLFKQHAELTGGRFQICSEKGKGTEISAVFRSDHTDIQPMGDLEACWVLLAASNPGVEIILQYRTAQGAYDINSKQVMEYLGVNSLSGYEMMNDIKRMIRNNIEELSFKSN